jgi:hypothetical protein
VDAAVHLAVGDDRGLQALVPYFPQGRTCAGQQLSLALGDRDCSGGDRLGLLW